MKAEDEGDSELKRFSICDAERRRWGEWGGCEKW
jgi:hypothetical protein